LVYSLKHQVKNAGRKRYKIYWPTGYTYKAGKKSYTIYQNDAIIVC